MVSEPWLDSAQAGRTGWVLPGKAHPCPICPPGWGLIHAWVSPGKVLVPLGNHLHLHPSLPVLHLDLPSLWPHWAPRWEVLSRV